jgi:hypothetical protein
MPNSSSLPGGGNRISITTSSGEGHLGGLKLSFDRKWVEMDIIPELCFGCVSSIE